MKTSDGSCDRLSHILIMAATFFLLLTEFGTLQAALKRAVGYASTALEAPHRQ